MQLNHDRVLRQNSMYEMVKLWALLAVDFVAPLHVFNIIRL
jgi:hypothetical protein